MPTMDSSTRRELRIREMLEKALDVPSWHDRLAAFQELSTFEVEQVARCGDKLVDHALRDAVVEVRQAAVQLLTALSPEQAQKFAGRIAAEGLCDEDRKVRAAAAETLGALGREIGGPHLDKVTGMLPDKSSQVRRAAARAVGRIGEPAKELIEQLIALLKDYESEVRAAAAAGLGFLGVGRFLFKGETEFEDEEIDIGVKLAAAAANDRSFSVRSGASTALASIDEGSRFSDVLLIAALEDPQAQVRAAAGAALAAIGGGRGLHVADLGEALTAGSAGKRRAAAEALRLQGEAAAPEASRLALSLRDDPDEEVRVAAALALRAIGKAAADNTEQMAEAAVFDECAEVQRAATENLRQLALDSSDCCEQVVAALAEEGAENRDSLRFGAASALGSQGQRAAPHAERLVSALSDTSWAVRRAAAEGLQHIGPAALPRAEAVLGQALQSKDADVRCSAIQVFGVLGAKSDQDGSTLEARRASLAQRRASLAQQVAGKIADEDKYVSAMAMRTLGSWGEAGARYAREIADQLRAKRPEVRIAAAGALRELGMVGKERLLPDQVDTLATAANTDISLEVRLEAVEACKALGEAGRLHGS